MDTSDALFRNQFMDSSFSMLDGEDNLVRDAVRGESSAFGALYDYYQPKIYRFVFIKVSRREEAEDITHQVFLNAWQSISTYKNFGFPFSSWLYRIARNQVIDYYRSNKGELRLDDVDQEVFAKLAKTESDLDVRFALDHVRSAIRKLKPEYQDILIMRFVEDLSPKEVAHAIGKSEGSVKVMQHRALKALKSILS